MHAYKQVRHGGDVVQVCKDALVMINSVLLVEASARLKAEHEFYAGFNNKDADDYGDPTAVDSRAPVLRGRDYKVMVDVHRGVL